MDPPFYLQTKGRLGLNKWVAYTVQYIVIVHSKEDLVCCHFDSFFACYLWIDDVLIAGTGNGVAKCLNGNMDVVTAVLHIIRGKCILAVCGYYLKQ